jgi:hypothetical protein
MNKLWMCFLVLFITAAGAIGQIKVTPQKTTYTRPKPIMDGKKTFSITWPKISGTSPEIAKKIEAALNYETIFEFTIKDEKEETQWLADGGYKVDYNRGKILSVSIWIEGSGAYPSTANKYITVDTSTGAAVKPDDVFANTAGLEAILTRMRAKEMADTKAKLAKDPEAKDVDIKTLFDESLEYNKISLDQFTVKDDGVLFHHNYDFPHAVQALAPAGEFLVKWAQLKPFIKAGGLFAGLGS